MACRQVDSNRRRLPLICLAGWRCNATECPPQPKDGRSEEPYLHGQEAPPADAHSEHDEQNVGDKEGRPPPAGDPAVQCQQERAQQAQERSAPLEYHWHQTIHDVVGRDHVRRRHNSVVA